MAVLMIGEVPNLTEDVYGGLIGQMKPGLHRTYHPLHAAFTA